MSKIFKCKFCGEKIKILSVKFSNCGEYIYFQKDFFKKTILGLTIVLLSSIIIKNYATSLKVEQPNLSYFSISNLFGYNDLKLQYSPINENYSYVNSKGQTTISLSRDIKVAYEFSEGLAIVFSNGKYGAIDATGKYVINPIYDDLWTTTEGLTAFICLENENDVNIGYLDKNGNVVIQPQMHKSDYCPETFLFNPEFSSGLAVSFDAASNKYGYINKTGEFVIKPQFNDALPFSEGLAAVKIDKADETEEKYGYIDLTGNYVISPQFSEAYEFKEGLALIAIDSEEYGRRYGYIDKEGKLVISAKYDKAYSFSDGLAAVHINGKWGYIDKTGQYAIKPSYDGIPYGGSSYERRTIDEDDNFAFSFVNGSAPVCLEWNNDVSKFALIDKSGKELTKQYFDDIDRVTGNTYTVTYYGKNGISDGAVGLIDNKGNWIEPIKRPEIKELTQSNKIPTNKSTNTSKIKNQNLLNSTKDLEKAEEDLLN